MINFIYSLFNQPAIIIGLIALIGLVVQKKSIEKIVSGTFKTILGFIILNQGGSIICSALNNLAPAIENAFHVRGVVLANEAIIGPAQEMFGSEIALIMAFGFLANILIARFTKFKYIFLSGHESLYMAATIAAVLVAAGFSGGELVVVGALILGFASTLCPAITQHWYRKVSGNDNVAMGHFNSITYSLSPLIAIVFGNPEKSTEKINVPKQVSFFRDNSISTAIVMLIVFLIAFLAADANVVNELSSGDNIAMFAFMQAMTFTAGLSVVLVGVRMMLAEIVPAFKGISKKVVPDAIPALDVPVLFPYAPNAVLIGFLASLVGGFLVFFVFSVTGFQIIVPGVINLFFVGAGVGVLANKVGGLRGTIAAGIFNGILITAIPAFMLPLLGKLATVGSTFGDADYSVVAIVTGYIAKYAGSIGVWSLIVLLVLGFAIGSIKKASKTTDAE